MSTATVSITYRPGEGDPHTTVWNGYKFRANEARDIPADATVAHDKSPMKMVDLAHGNPHFEVGGTGGKPKNPKAKAAADKADPKQPKTSEEYRAHAVAWINAAEDFDAFTKQWEAETEMRELAGCGEDDIDFLQQFYAPKHDQLRKARLAATR
jgi:hypothetical protein